MKKLEKFFPMINEEEKITVEKLKSIIFIFI